METVASKINNFIESLNLPENSKVLFETVDCCKSFFESYYMRNKYLVDDLYDFREYKIKNSKKTLDLFLEECYTKGVKLAFESTFYQPLTKWKVEMIEQAITEGRTSMVQLFDKFQKNPNENILKNVI